MRLEWGWAETLYPVLFNWCKILSQSEKFEIPFAIKSLTSVFGFLPNCNSNGKSLIFEWGVSLRFPKALLSASLRPIRGAEPWLCFIGPIVLSTRPVRVCKFGVPNNKSMFNRPQKFLNSRPVKEVPWLVTIWYSVGGNVCFHKFHRQLCWSWVNDTGYRPFWDLSTPTSIHLFGRRPSISQWKSSCSSSLGCEGYLRTDLSVLGLVVFLFLPAW